MSATLARPASLGSSAGLTAMGSLGQPGSLGVGLPGLLAILFPCSLHLVTVTLASAFPPPPFGCQTASLLSFVLYTCAVPSLLFRQSGPPLCDFLARWLPPSTRHTSHPAITSRQTHQQICPVYWPLFAHWASRYCLRRLYSRSATFRFLHLQPACLAVSCS